MAREPLAAQERRRILGLALTCPFLICFWIAQSQVWNVYNLWVRDHVALGIGSFQVPVPWLQALDIFALPSYANEGVPQALLQAMLAGLPCVTTHVGGIGELAIDGTTALVVPPENVEALRAALERLMHDETLRANLGGMARQHCVERFSYERMLDRMETIYREAAAYLER